MRVVDGEVTDVTNLTATLNDGLARPMNSISSFGTDARGEVYICDRSFGAVYRVVPSLEGNPPIARVEAAESEVTLGDDPVDIILSAEASTDGDRGKQPLTITWEQISGPDASLIRRSATTARVTIGEPGEFSFRTTVVDPDGEASADVVITAVELPPVVYRRGDSNVDGLTDLSDGVTTLNFLFVGGTELTCLSAADADSSGLVNITDVVFLFGYLFTGGDFPSAPGPIDCGPGDGGAGDALGCELYDACGGV